MNNPKQFDPKLHIEINDITEDPRGLLGHVESFFVRHKDKLVWVHAVMFVAFVALIFLPLFLSELSEQAGPLVPLHTLCQLRHVGAVVPVGAVIRCFHRA